MIEIRRIASEVQRFAERDGGIDVLELPEDAGERIKIPPGSTRIRLPESPAPTDSRI